MRQGHYGLLGAGFLVSGIAMVLVTLIVLGSGPGAITGTALIVLGLVMLSVGRAEGRMSAAMAHLLSSSGYQNIERMVEELGLSGRAIYLPTTLSHIGARALIPLDVARGTIPAGAVDDRFIARYGQQPSDVGLLVVTPGSAVLELLSSPVGEFPEGFEVTLSTLATGALEVARGVVVHHSNGKVSVTYAGVREGRAPADSPMYRTVGSPLASVAATLLAESCEAPVVVVSESRDGEGYSVELEVLGDAT